MTNSKSWKKKMKNTKNIEREAQQIKIFSENILGHEQSDRFELLHTVTLIIEKSFSIMFVIVSEELLAKLKLLVDIKDASDCRLESLDNNNRT